MTRGLLSVIDGARVLVRSAIDGVDRDDVDAELVALLDRLARALRALVDRLLEVASSRLVVIAGGAPWWSIPTRDRSTRSVLRLV